VSRRRKRSLGSSAQDRKKVNTFSYLRFFIRFSFLIVTANDCQACEEADTYENIMDNYCRADFGESHSPFPSIFFLFPFLFILGEREIEFNKI
jgi:hypothetical protein